MKDVTATIMETACDLTRHAAGCWLLNTSPLRRVWWWSLGIGQ